MSHMIGSNFSHGIQMTAVIITIDNGFISHFDAVAVSLNGEYNARLAIGQPTWTELG